MCVVFDACVYCYCNLWKQNYILEAKYTAIKLTIYSYEINLKNNQD